MRGCDHVEHMKAQDENNVGIPTLMMHSHDKLLPRLVAVWLTVARRLGNPGMHQTIPPELPMTERTRYLWACIEPDPVPIWAQAAGLPCAPHVESAMMVLVDNCVVFPDGTLSDWAKRYLDTEAKRFGFESRSVAPEMP